MGKITFREFVKKAQKRHGEFYTYPMQPYVNNVTKVAIVCPVHGGFWQTPAAHLHLKNNTKVKEYKGCPECAKISRGLRRRSVFADLLAKAHKAHGDLYGYDESTYTTMTKPFKLTCKQHGEFWQTMSVHLKGHGCPKCAIELNSNRLRGGLKEFISMANIVHENLYTYILDQPYFSRKHKLIINCKTHGNFTQEANNHLQGHGCPKCAKVQSKGELQLLEFVKTLCPSLEILHGCRTVIKSPTGVPLELDIFIPELNLAVEYNGVIFHSELFEKSTVSSKDSHRQKTDLCNAQGIKLIHIWEDDWNGAKQAVKNMLSHKLGKSQQVTYARTCEIKKVSIINKREALTKWHIQGDCNGSAYLGLYKEADLVAVLVMSKNLSNRGTKFSGVWELARYACKGSVIGGVSKLLSHFIKLYEPSGIVSYSDNCISEGEVYALLGFTLTKELPPDYKYAKGSTRFHKSGFKKSLLKKRLEKFDPSESEYENCRVNGFYRIWDCGKRKWEMRL